MKRRNNRSCKTKSNNDRNKKQRMTFTLFGKEISKNAVGTIMTLIAVVIAFCFLRNLFFYMTESGINEDEKYPAKGVDISRYQGDVDWRGLKSEGISFAFIKATEGVEYVDPNFKINWKRAHRTGMRVGAYHFMNYETDGKEQAKNFKKTVGRKFGMLPPVIDVEFYGKYVKTHPSKELMYSRLDVMLDELEGKYHKKPIIYTNKYIYKKYISERYESYPIWISDHDLPDKLYDGREWDFCQYTFKGKLESVGGGTKHVDMNVFNGSKWELRKYKGNQN